MLLSFFLFVKNGVIAIAIITIANEQQLNWNYD